MVTVKLLEERINKSEIKAQKEKVLTNLKHSLLESLKNVIEIVQTTGSKEITLETLKKEKNIAPQIKKINLLQKKIENQKRNIISDLKTQNKKKLQETAKKIRVSDQKKKQNDK